MVHTIDNIFAEEFEAEVHHEFQRMGSMIRGTVRTKDGIVGKSTNFPVAGKGKAGSKTRHGKVPIMNAERRNVPCPLNDRYAAEYIDKLDELKTQTDERQTASQSIAYAMGRDVDDILLTTFSGTTTGSTTPVTWADSSGPRDIMASLGETDVPFDRNLYSVVCWQAWADLLDLDEFSRQEYVPGDRLWFEGVTAKFWLGANWFPHSGLPKTAGGDFEQFWYHRTAAGHAFGQDYELDLDWEGETQAWLATACMSHGSCLIDEVGVHKTVYDVTP